ncbi:hypothetical protein BCAH1134_C0337 (plasmid) [Bacillus cereus AH1134]|nr:hypothetical protein BCAH1134_C0337 [Bacillus cereus AH1134]
MLIVPLEKLKKKLVLKLAILFIKDFMNMLIQLSKTKI